MKYNLNLDGKDQSGWVGHTVIVMLPINQAMAQLI